MIQLLRILAVISVVAAIAVVGIAGVRLTGGSAEKPEILTKPSTVDRFKEARNAPTENRTAESPLVAQARRFALGIDPPPPPAPPAPERPTPVARQPQPQIPSAPPEPVVERPEFSGTYKLVATARYPDYPEKSLALLDLTGKGLKWFRIGDQVNHQTIQDIQEDRIVVAQNGQSQTVSIDMKPSTVRDLLNGEGANRAASTPAVPVYEAIASDIRASASASSAYSGPEAGATTVRQPVTAGSSRLSGRTAPDRIVRHEISPTATRTISLPGRTPTPPTRTITPAASANDGDNTRRLPYRRPPVITRPPDREQTINENISDIRKLMSTSAEGDDPQAAKELENWQQLLKMLEQERDQAKSDNAESPPAAEQEPAK